MKCSRCLGTGRVLSVLERFWLRIEKTDTCWIWHGTINQMGYGVFQPIAHKSVYAHRFSYALANGDACLVGLTLDHLCRIPPCVRPDHLEPVTRSENSRRANPIRLHCKRGHLLIEPILILRPDNQGWTRRICRECRKLRSKRWYARHRISQ